MVKVYLFTADWCAPCKQLKPRLKKLLEKHDEFKNVEYVEVDTEKDPDTAKRFEVLNLPTIILEKDGKIEKRLVGNYSTTTIYWQLIPLVEG